MPFALRLLGAILGTGVILFCLYGILASFEATGGARIRWQLGYASVAFAGAIGVILLLWPRKR
jgi:hypothetical protein